MTLKREPRVAERVHRNEWTSGEHNTYILGCWGGGEGEGEEGKGMMISINHQLLSTQPERKQKKLTRTRTDKQSRLPFLDSDIFRIGVRIWGSGVLGLEREKRWDGIEWLWFERLGVFCARKARG